MLLQPAPVDPTQLQGGGGPGGPPPGGGGGSPGPPPPPGGRGIYLSMAVCCGTLTSMAVCCGIHMSMAVRCGIYIAVLVGGVVLVGGATSTTRGGVCVLCELASTAFNVCLPGPFGRPNNPEISSFLLGIRSRRSLSMHCHAVRKKNYSPKIRSWDRISRPRGMLCRQPSEEGATNRAGARVRRLREEPPLQQRRRHSERAGITVERVRISIRNPRERTGRFPVRSRPNSFQFFLRTVKASAI